ncbi:hypothetical protein BC835DRAFT_1306715 [Cytidiella melzeri]|nr:hypothetical protein BC835DRAFT_1306715 [Cytidiella melzeri]
MLPKVANHLLQHTSRAVAAVQNHTIRNVLQIQSSPSNNIANWNGSTSSSGRGGSGPGAGGAKYHSSRFHNSFSSLGRGVTLADPSISSGTRGELADDSDDFQIATVETRPIPARTRQRIRSSSLSFTIQDSVSKDGILRTLRQHVRSRHAFAQLQPDSKQQRSSRSPPRALNAPEIGESRMDATKAIHRLNSACHSQKPDWEFVNRTVKYLYLPDAELSIDLFNTALRALLITRGKRNSNAAILRLYNLMTSSSVKPDGTTYELLIAAITTKEHDHKLAIDMYQKTLPLLAGDAASMAKREETIAKIEKQSSLPLAVALFQLACKDSTIALPPIVYDQLLRTCADKLHMDAGTLIFSEGRHRGLKLSARTWSSYLSLCGEVGDLAGAIRTFGEFRVALQEGQVPTETTLDSVGITSVWAEMMYTYICHRQPEEALRLLEEMLDSTATAVPRPNAVTFSRIIQAFAESGDMQSALGWFNRLLEQQATCIDPTVLSVEPTKPAPEAWDFMLLTLANHRMIGDLDRLVRLAKVESLYKLTPLNIASIITAHISHLQNLPDISAADGVARLDSLVSSLLSPGDMLSTLRLLPSQNLSVLCRILVQQYSDYDRPDRALEVITDVFAAPILNLFRDNDLARNFVDMDRSVQRLQDVIHETVDLLSTTTASSWTLAHAARLAQLSALLTNTPSDIAASHMLTMYARSGPAEKDTLSVAEWEAVFECYVAASDEARMTIQPLDIFQDGLTRGARLADLREQTVESVVAFLQANLSGPQQLAIGAQLGISDFLRRDSDVDTQASGERESTSTAPSSGTAPKSPISSHPTPASASITIDLALSKSISDSLRSYGADPFECYKQFEAAVQTGTYPDATAVGRLINAMGRIGQLDKVHILYDAAQTLLASMDNKRQQSYGWFQIEDQMIIALAHAGEVEAAHVHRHRILLQKGTPSPDAYGILIQSIKDTTDDTSNALALFNESVERKVVPNTYLYNIIISKLAKARKADNALELFRQMKARNLVPTSVTYGALISACGRVGDITSAENLFAEMASQPNFRPRIPPYNMMMQLYTQTKPDRKRALDYYHAMLDANIKPTAHTYKLLLDTYGMVEPADTDAMEAVFHELLGSKIPVSGQHWAALINAYGCVQKDLDKAVSVFESIKDHPSTKQSSASLPDAVSFEALINVFNTVRRTDLIPEYLAKLPEYGIHMTAYIANVLIRGYAMHGDIGQARAVFESLVDPPEGMAALNNHAPHDSEQVVSVPADAPVYREPSTWEAMVRAELGNGNRDQAIALLERVKARRFPIAVYNRISGIMLDDSVAPWTQDSDAVPA